MMLVLSLLIVASVLLSFFSVDEMAAGITQALSGSDAVYALLGLLALVLLLLGWRVWKRRAAP